MAKDLNLEQYKLMLEDEDITLINDRRRWQLTIHKPLDREYYINHLLSAKGLRYGCGCYEIGGKTGREHLHLYLVYKSAKRFETLQKEFPGAHIEHCKANNADNIAYVEKSGKWENCEKGLTSLKDTFFEVGERPEDIQGKRKDIDILYELIKKGFSNLEILDVSSSYMQHLDTINKIRNEFQKDKFHNKFRELEVTYIYGLTGKGKTRYVMDKYGYENVYRVTDYSHPFDSYNGQDVIIFDEFRSSLKCSDMLVYLDGYPVELPARFYNRHACFTKVFIISNITINEQYTNIQQFENETFQAFLRRITKYMTFDNTGSYEFLSYSDYMKNDYLQFA